MKDKGVSKNNFDINLKAVSDKRIGIVKSSWNSLITDRLYEGSINTLIENGIKKEDIRTLVVPGSFELIYGAKKLYTQYKADAIIVIGSVIQGETPHFNFICQSIANGIKDLNILFDIPLIFCVSTDLNINQAKERSGGKMGNKGVDCAYAALQLIQDS